jgi:hypothetical protein
MEVVILAEKLIILVAVIHSDFSITICYSVPFLLEIVFDL